MDLSFNVCHSEILAVSGMLSALLADIFITPLLFKQFLVLVRSRGHFNTIKKAKSMHDLSWNLITLL